MFSHRAVGAQASQGASGAEEGEWKATYLPMTYNQVLIFAKKNFPLTAALGEAAGLRASVAASACCPEGVTAGQKKATFCKESRWDFSASSQHILRKHGVHTVV